MKFLLIALSLPLGALAGVLWLLGVLAGGVSWACMACFLSIAKAIADCLGVKLPGLPKEG